MPEVKLNDFSIYYESHGEGEPLIMIRGLGSNADHWYAQVPELSKHYRVITFDNRGIGRSGDPGGAFTVPDMAADAIGVMDALGIESAHILGLSMGGMIAQELVLSNPKRVKGLVLVVTHCGAEHQVNATDEVMQTIQRMAVDDSIEARTKAAVVFFAPATLSDRLDVVQEYGTVSMKHPAGGEILQRQMGALQTHDTYDRLPQIKAPTLVLTGAEDVLIPPENSRIIADRIPGAECLVLEGGGHQILIEQPEACNRAIIDFLKKVDGPNA